MHDQQVRRRRGNIRIRFLEIELQLQRRELRVHHAQELRGGPIAALTLAKLIAAVGAGESHGVPLVSVETGPTSITGTPAPSAGSPGSGSPETRASFLAS